MKRISKLLSLNSQQQKLIDIEKEHVVEAGAGSGKTRVLVSRYLQILESGSSDAGGIVAITFTINAANEMKERIRSCINQYIDAYGENENINRGILKDIADAPITTIHGFAARIIRENPYECNINSRIKILEGLDRKLFIDQAIDEFLAKSSAKDKNLSRIFENENYSYASVKTTLMQILELVCRHHIDVSENLISDKDLTKEINKLNKKLGRLIKTGPFGSGNKKIDSRLKEFHLIINDLENTGLRTDRVNCLNRAGLILSNTGSPRGILELKASTDIERQFAASCADIINQMISLYELQNTDSYLNLFLKFYDFYKQKKSSNGYLEFEDLLQNALLLLKDNPEILGDYKNKFRYFLVDEFQDTDELQYELINLFSGSNHFIVGDPKQSIFGFRGAVPEIFSRLTNSGNKSALKYNYRSDSRLISFYNKLFGIIIKESYQEMSHASASDSAAHIKEIIHSTVNKGDDRVFIEAGSVATKVSELLRSGYRKKDIALLLRSKSHIEYFEKALGHLSIPFYSSESAGFYRYRQVRDIVSLLRYILNENDKISEASVLRSAFAGVTDEQLLAYYVKREKVEIIDSYLKFVTELRELSHALNPLQLLMHILDKTLYWSSMLALPEGKKKYESITKLIEIFSYQHRQGKSLTEIISFLDLNYEENTEGLSQVQLDESDTVKILTVHKAKGLEFPVVILADINHGMKGDTDAVGYSDKYKIIVRSRGVKSAIWKDMSVKKSQQTYQEEKRSLYVAMTRAKEKLIISVCSNTRPQKGTYLDILNPIIALSSVEADQQFVEFKDYRIPVTHYEVNNVPDPTYDDEPEYKTDITQSISAADSYIETKKLADRDLTVPDYLSFDLNNVQTGSLMHRFLQIWSFTEQSIEATIDYVLNESFVVDPKMEQMLIVLSGNFLGSDLFAQIKDADEIKRELPFYIELDGQKERRKIDLLIFKDGNISLYDYKLSAEIKDEYVEQMNLYKRALLKKYSCDNITVNLVQIPDVVINSLNYRA